MNAACPRRVSLIIAGGLPAIPTPTISAPTGDRPAASGFTPAPTGFAFHSQARPATPTESSSRRTARRPSCVSDWSFSFRCSPPRVTTAQLRFDTARFFTAQERTSTALSPRLLRRTSAGLPAGFAGAAPFPRSATPQAGCKPALRGFGLPSHRQLGDAPPQTDCHNQA